MRPITLPLSLILFAFAGCTPEVGSQRFAVGEVVDETAPPSGYVVVSQDGGVRDGGEALPTLAADPRPIRASGPELPETARRLEREAPSLQAPEHAGPGGDPCPAAERASAASS